MDFLRVSSICLCANRRLRMSCRRTEPQVMVKFRGQQQFVQMSHWYKATKYSDRYFPLCCWGHIIITVLDSAVCTAGMTRSPSSAVTAEHFHTSHSPCKQAHRTHHRELTRFQSFLHGSLPQGAGRVQTLAPRKQIHIYTTKRIPLPMNSFF